MNTFGHYIIDPDSFEHGVKGEKTCSDLVGCFSNILQSGFTNGQVNKNFLIDIGYSRNVESIELFKLKK